MNRIVLILAILLAIPFLGTAQDDVNPHKKNFKIENKEVIWQYTFDSDLKIDSLKITYYKKIISSIDIDNFNELEDRFSFFIKNEKINRDAYYTGGGFNDPKQLNYPLNYFVIVDFKNFKYRVTIKKMFVDATSNRYLGIIDIETLLTKSGVTKFKTTKYSIGFFEVLDKYFLDEFAIKNIALENDDW